jgi:hypothetical protein
MITLVEKNNPAQLERTLVTDTLARRFIVSTISLAQDLFPSDDYMTAVFEAHPEGDHPFTFADLKSPERSHSADEARELHQRTCEGLKLFLIPLYTDLMVRA